jgi:preprotein translocase subunit YajC
MSVFYQSYFLAVPGATEGLGGMFLTMGLIFAAMWFLMIRPQRKRDKTQREMRSKLEVGDEVITVGGIIGRVVSLREDSLVIETGSGNTRIRITRAAVQTNNTVHDDTAS